MPLFKRTCEATGFHNREDANVFKKCIRAAALLGQCWTKDLEY